MMPLTVKHFEREASARCVGASRSLTTKWRKPMPRAKKTRRAVIGGAALSMVATVWLCSQSKAQTVNHCRPDGAGGFICQLEQATLKGPPPMTPELAEMIRKVIRSQIAPVPYTMTPDELTDAERNGGTATNEERAAQPGSQFTVCEDRSQKIGYAHLTQASICSGLSLHAPSAKQQAAFLEKQQAEFQASLDVQRKAGEALRDKIIAERAKRQQP
jgi:hypothetical protein